MRLKALGESPSKASGAGGRGSEAVYTRRCVSTLIQQGWPKDIRYP